MSYTEKLRKRAVDGESLLCMGIDPVLDYIPSNGNGTKERITSFFGTIFDRMVTEGITPGAFKPNLGFFSCLDRPREGIFEGSAALSAILDMLDTMFTGVPVILDYKRGDIARSSANYALEGFGVWGTDAVTVSPYMGSDSVEPFLKEAFAAGGGVYVLDRTSNPGGREFQNMKTDGGEPLYIAVAKKILSWAVRYPGTGAVTGATSPEELGKIAEVFINQTVPLLIPGVGSQGGSVSEVLKVLKQREYDVPVVRINISRAVSYPWVRNRSGFPRDFGRACADSFKKFADEAGGAL